MNFELRILDILDLRPECKLLSHYWTFWTESTLYRVWFTRNCDRKQFLKKKKNRKIGRRFAFYLPSLRRVDTFKKNEISWHSNMLFLLLMLLISFNNWTKKQRFGEDVATKIKYVNFTFDNNHNFRHLGILEFIIF